ncbi:hypothetical protein Rsub_13175 [Raphidocelis subcapitata]|uniref:Uncharacterized protein n=1 Tax=Raphidocelis subcapitata TaxID=307507 RepID=A0A2V0PMT7_9CHLO|nr:hypothetical protein Rsub_13175 [Raphidocelis subcapitata]|eukprot:GBG00413.1 hypothetical protein Rsub_13175 [Raphidocelis subcapitata]
MSKALLKKQLAALHSPDAPAPSTKGGVSKHAGDPERSKLEKVVKKAAKGPGKRPAGKDEIARLNLEYYRSTKAAQEATQALMNKLLGRPSTTTANDSDDDVFDI